MPASFIKRPVRVVVVLIFLSSAMATSLNQKPDSLHVQLCEVIIVSPVRKRRAPVPACAPPLLIGEVHHSNNCHRRIFSRYNTRPMKLSCLRGSSRRAQQGL